MSHAFRSRHRDAASHAGHSPVQAHGGRVTGSSAGLAWHASVDRGESL